jgi:hypothetical protein
MHKYVLFVFCSTIESSGRAVVKADFLAVYSNMTKESAVVKFLKKGEVVTIELEIEWEKGAWCVIAEQGETTPTGYVQCRHLVREEPPGPVWEKVEKPTLVEPPPEEPAPAPLEGEPAPPLPVAEPAPAQPFVKQFPPVAEPAPAQPFVKQFPPVAEPAPPPPAPGPPARPGKCVYTSRKDRPAILNAAVDASAETVKSLLKEGADVNKRDTCGFTALEWAVRFGHIDIVKILLANGGDIHARNYDIGCPPLTWAAAKGHTDIVEVLLDNLECMLSGEGALSAAAKEGHTDILRTLLDRGADADGKNKLGETALMGAAKKGHIDIVKVLIASGADLNEKDNDGNTALKLAAKAGYIEIVELLKDFGAGE